MLNRWNLIDPNTGEIKRTVTLPAGMALSPILADGTEAEKVPETEAERRARVTAHARAVADRPPVAVYTKGRDGRLVRKLEDTGMLIDSDHGQRAARSGAK